MGSLADDTRALLADFGAWVETVPRVNPALRDADQEATWDAMDAAETREEKLQVLRETSALSFAANTALTDAFNERFEMRLLDILRRLDEAGAHARHIPRPGPTVEGLAWAYARPGDWAQLVSDLEDRLARIDPGS